MALEKLQRQESLRINLDVGIDSPKIILPRNSRPENCELFIADLGPISIKTCALPTPTKESSFVVVDDFIISVSDMKMSSKHSNVDKESHIIKGLSYSLHLQRNSQTNKETKAYT
jgi:hypothetical protein